MVAATIQFSFNNKNINHIIIMSEATCAARDTLVWGRAASVGFIPLFSGSIIQIPIQIGMFIFFTLLLIFLFKVPWYISIPSAYILQALLVMLMVAPVADLVLDMTVWPSC